MEDLRPGVSALGSDTSAPTADADAVDAALAASGDACAFERLYRGHVARIFGLARRMVGPEDAEEATQEVFVRVWRKLGTFRGESAFGTWLHRVAINLFLGRRETLGIARARHVDGDGPIELMSAPRGQVELHMDFDTAIARLPKGARQIFVLHDVEGYKHQEIADMLGVSAGTSKAQLHRARMALRKYLDR